MKDISPAEIARRRFFPWLLWGGLITLAFFLYQRVGPGSPVQGYAEAIPYPLSSVEPARVESVLVKPGDRVRAGQVVAILDASAIEAELRVVEADKARVIAEIAKAEVEARAAHFDQTRNIQEEQGQVERASRDAKTRLETARAQLKAVESELARRAPLVRDGVLMAQDLADLQIQKAALAKQVTEETAAIEMLGGQTEAAKQLTPPAEGAWVDAVKAPLNEEAKMLENSAALLRVRRDQYILRAPIDGSVASVAGGQATVVTPGTPFIQIVADTSDRIVACVLDGQHKPIAQGDLATARSLAGRTDTLRGKAVSVTPVVELPVRCWRDPRFPLYGHIVTVELTPPTPLVPGEAFEVRFESPGT